MEQIKALITEEGWTPQVKTRRASQKQYLYAARRNKIVSSGMEWRYLGTLVEAESMTQEEIRAKLRKVESR